MWPRVITLGSSLLLLTRSVEVRALGGVERRGAEAEGGVVRLKRCAVRREKAAAKSDRNRERSKWETTQGAGPQARAKKGREREREREERESKGKEGEKGEKRGKERKGEDKRY